MTMPAERGDRRASLQVSILCQSRLFLLHTAANMSAQQYNTYPSSVNRGYFSYSLRPVWTLQRCQYPSSVNRGYFSYYSSADVLTYQVRSIHPLSIEAISPTYWWGAGPHQYFQYPSSVNRGYFSYTQQLRLVQTQLIVSILCQSRLFLLPDLGLSVRLYASEYPSSVNRGYFSYRQYVNSRVGSSFWYPSSVNRGYFSY